MSVQVAFIIASVLHALRKTLLDDSSIEEDIVETIYKALGKCKENDVDITLVHHVVAIVFIVSLISFALVVIPLIISLITYR